MSFLPNPSLHPEHVVETVREVSALQALNDLLAKNGVTADPEDCANLFISLKAKPHLLLAGPERSGKVAALRSLAQLLMGGERPSFQLLAGQPWWNGDQVQASILAASHRQYVQDKFSQLLEHASQPSRARQVHMLCLARLSSHELAEYFAAPGTWSAAAFAGLAHPPAGAASLIPYPPNFILAGTLEAGHGLSLPEAVLEQTSLIHWNAQTSSGFGRLSTAVKIPPLEKEFLRGRIRSERIARNKLSDLLGWGLLPLRTLTRTASLLEQNGVDLPEKAMGEALIYVANAWSRSGAGLFSYDSYENSLTAMDYALTQTILPRAAGAIAQDKALAEALLRRLESQFPCCTRYLKSLMLL